VDITVFTPAVNFSYRAEIQCCICQISPRCVGQSFGFWYPECGWVWV